MSKSLILGRLAVSHRIRQAAGAPVIDGGTTYETDGTRYGTIIITIRRDGRHAIGLGWRGAAMPRPQHWRILPRRLRAMRR